MYHSLWKMRFLFLGLRVVYSCTRTRTRTRRTAVHTIQKLTHFVLLALRVQLYTCTGRATKIFDFFRMNEDTSPTYTTTVLYVYYKRNYEHVCSYESCYEYVALYSKYMYVQLYTYVYC